MSGFGLTRAQLDDLQRVRDCRALVGAFIRADEPRFRAYAENPAREREGVWVATFGQLRDDLNDAVGAALDSGVPEHFIFGRL
ncbi:hypothetical protein [Rhodococcus opacus]|uniref:hypothetical protein n=1 Tax=Rhodococcus opacus TaxID=37919 RepID=UPI0024B945BF|nr:hypothetical protein [Rhodococcus opacus]MDJ0419833.1 hypothetical protein [Rhodococcus opacus]